MWKREQLRSVSASEYVRSNALFNVSEQIIADLTPHNSRSSLIYKMNIQSLRNKKNPPIKGGRR